MIPIGLLMIEHRLIERMITVMRRELNTMQEKKRVDPVFIDAAVDFSRTYADRCHHGKEEEILFRDLAAKQLSPEHRKIMNELIAEHRMGRKLVNRLVSAKERYLQCDTNALEEVMSAIEFNRLESAKESYVQCDMNALREIMAGLEELVKFYPSHIEKEDRQFFIPSMEYFSKQEKDDMLQKFYEFDKNVIHEKYRAFVERFE